MATGTIWNIRERLEENFSQAISLLEHAAESPDVRIQIAASAEIRHHLELADKMLREITSMEETLAFQDQVIELLGRISKRERDRFVEAWKKRCAGEPGPTICTKTDDSRVG